MRLRCSPNKHTRKKKHINTSTTNHKTQNNTSYYNAITHTHTRKEMKMLHGHMAPWTHGHMAGCMVACVHDGSGKTEQNRTEEHNEQGKGWNSSKSKLTSNKQTSKQATSHNNKPQPSIKLGLVGGCEINSNIDFVCEIPHSRHIRSNTRLFAASQHVSHSNITISYHSTNSMSAHHMS